MDKPSLNVDKTMRFDSFFNGEKLRCKTRNRMPAMGWNSWNAFGSGNNEELTLAMAQKIKELGLDELGYKYVVLDDGCYKTSRVDGKLTNEPEKFPSGFSKISDQIHSMGLKFGMYNCIGTNLCAGAEVGTYGHEETDAKSYLDWKIDLLKVDNCYYMWDNATFANPENALYSYAPNIKAIKIDGREISAAEGEITGTRAERKGDYVSFIGTFDGTGPDHSPVGIRSSELIFTVESETAKTCELQVLYATGKEEGVGAWLQVGTDELFFDDLLPFTDSTESFVWSEPISIKLNAGTNRLRIMNHRRQENTIYSFAKLKDALYTLDPDNDIILSLCEWGKTHPQNWGYKVGDYWRILNDITFGVGSAEGDFGSCVWECDYTTSITSQYNKAVIMDEFAGIDKGWNDPDMMVIGMNGLTPDMQKSHMAMWCMMNVPIMLGLDLRRVEKGDELYEIIANKDLIDIDQDALGIQAKRIFTTIASSEPDKDYIRDNNRTDVLCKPLADGSIALGFFNLRSEEEESDVSVDTDLIISKIGHKMVDPDKFKNASSYEIKDMWSSDETTASDKRFSSGKLRPCEGKVMRIKPL